MVYRVTLLSVVILTVLAIAETCEHQDCLSCICEGLTYSGNANCGSSWNVDNLECGKGCKKNTKNRCGCGPFSITKKYFKKCKALTTLSEKKWKRCSKQEACARQCVCALVNNVIPSCLKAGQQVTCNLVARIHYMGIDNRKKCQNKKAKVFAKDVQTCHDDNFEAAAPCIPISLDPYSTVNPGVLWGVNNDLETDAPPRRFPSTDLPKPTHHFSINQAKNNMVPVILYPYSAFLLNQGAVYDAYTLDRWSSEDRQMLRLQDTPNLNTWEKFPEIGTNMDQMVMGPDGNPFGQFTGRSGILVGLDGNTEEPVLEEFGDLFANWKYKELEGTGEIEVPLVRGSALLSHVFTDANPLIKGFCLTSVNGVQTSLKYTCPIETPVFDVGSGYLDGSNCIGGTLHIVLRMTKPRDISQIQWAANTLADWPTSHVMKPCGAECVSSDSGKRIDITVPGASGTMAFGINNIGYYTVPVPWFSDPATVECVPAKRKRSVKPENDWLNEDIQEHRVRRDLGAPIITSFCFNSPELKPCDAEYCIYTFVEGLQFKLVIVLRDPYTDVLSNIKIAFKKLPFSLMWIACSSSHCSLDATKTIFTFCSEAADPGIYGYAILMRVPIPSGSFWSDPFWVELQPTPQIFPSADKFILELDEPGPSLPDQTRKYVVYLSQVVNASFTGNGLLFTLPSGEKFSGLLQVGYLGAGPRGDVSGNDFLDPYRGVYSLNPTVSYCTDDLDSTVVSFNWNKQGGPGDLLMVALPHHENMLDNLIDTPFTFKSHVGEAWDLNYNLPKASIMPDESIVAAIKADPVKLQDITDGLDLDMSQLDIVSTCTTSASYFAGKDIALAARAATISRAFNTTHYQTFDTAILNCLNKWLRIDDTLNYLDKFHFDTVWGGLMNERNAFGFKMYSDHHFHIGYWLYAIAYYAKFYPTWATANREPILFLARDVGNGASTDPYFPVVRHKDIFLGHSWASGVQIGTRDQESSSEAINCYHALAALGESMGIDNMKQLGQTWLAMELLSVRQYYHVRENNQNQFPSLIRTFGGIGMFSEHAVYIHSLFFGCDPLNVYPARHGCVRGIQVLPITTISDLYLDKGWSDSIINSCSWAINPTTNPDAGSIDPSLLVPVSFGWGAFCMIGMSASSANMTESALNFVRGHGPHDFVSGTGAASTMLFLHGRT